jgi:hypothetical protein
VIKHTCVDRSVEHVRPLPCALICLTALSEPLHTCGPLSSSTTKLLQYTRRSDHVFFSNCHSESALPTANKQQLFANKQQLPEETNAGEHFAICQYYERSTRYFWIHRCQTVESVLRIGWKDQNVQIQEFVILVPTVLSFYRCMLSTRHAAQHTPVHKHVTTSLTHSCMSKIRNHQTRLFCRSLRRNRRRNYICTSRSEFFHRSKSCITCTSYSPCRPAAGV